VRRGLDEIAEQTQTRVVSAADMSPAPAADNLPGNGAAAQAATPAVPSNAGLSHSRPPPKGKLGGGSWCHCGAEYIYPKQIASGGFVVKGIAHGAIACVGASCRLPQDELDAILGTPPAPAAEACGERLPDPRVDREALVAFAGSVREPTGPLAGAAPAPPPAAGEPGWYRKRPVVVEAMRWDGTRESHHAIRTWRKSSDSRGNILWSLHGNTAFLSMETMEGTMRADVGDWIIRGVKGEFYPCKPDVFAATYELLSAGDPGGAR
jgi:hypothetical protein